MMNRDNRYSYQNVKEMARSRRTWTDWCTEPALGTEPKEVTSLWWNPVISKNADNADTAN